VSPLERQKGWVGGAGTTTTMDEDGIVLERVDSNIAANGPINDVVVAIIVAVVVVVMVDLLS